MEGLVSSGNLRFDNLAWSLLELLSDAKLITNQ